jgi:hypothetical protein
MSWKGLLELQGVWQGGPAPADVGFHSLLELTGVWPQGIRQLGRKPKAYVETDEEELLWIIYAAYDAGYLDGYIN